jgi:hypothetical protein
MPTTQDQEHGDEYRAVKLPSGATFYVYSQELGYVTERVKRYQKDNKFVNISDLQDIDRMLILELLIWRYGTWITQQRDYWGDPVDEQGTGKHLKDLSAELRNVKQSLGIDKVSRDKQKGEESALTYLQNLRMRAREFGVMRESQLNKSLELFNEAKALVTLHFNCDDEERRELHVQAKDILEWFRDKCIPEYDELDAHFRTNKQKFWIRDQ